MRGTFAYCRTKEAKRRMMDGDIIQRLRTEQYFKYENDTIYVSTDCHKWGEFLPPMETFPPYEEWKSLSNLHYYDDLKKELGDQKLWYLTKDEKVVDEYDMQADKSKKRWFAGDLLDSWLHMM